MKPETYINRHGQLIRSMPNKLRGYGLLITHVTGVFYVEQLDLAILTTIL